MSKYLKVVTAHQYIPTNVSRTLLCTLCHGRNFDVDRLSMPSQQSPKIIIRNHLCLINQFLCGHFHQLWNCLMPGIEVGQLATEQPVCLTVEYCRNHTTNA